MSRGTTQDVQDIAGQLTLDPEAALPLYRQIAAGITKLVEAQKLDEGDRLPPIRDLAQALRISHITMSQAYTVLRADGVVRTAPGQGTIILGAGQAVAPGPPASGGSRASRAGVIHRSLMGTEKQGRADSGWAQPGEEGLSWPSFVRSPRTSMLQSAARGLEGRDAGDIIHLETGQPDAALLPLEALRRTWTKALRDTSSRDLLYTGPQGDPVVRAVLAEYCASLGYVAVADEVLVTTGTQQSLDLVIRTFIRPGEHVLVESPGYPSALDLLESHGCRLVPVPVDGEGLRTDLLPALIARFQPRLLYLAPTGHNPTGTVLSAHRREALRTLIGATDLLVLEDDVCSELLYEGRPQQGVRTPTTRGRVITLKSFAKTVLPGLRVGCLLAAPALLGPLAATKALTDRFTSPLAQQALKLYLEGRSLRTDLARARDAYRERRDVMAAELHRVLPAEVRWTLPAAGLNLWLSLPPGNTAGEVRQLAAARGVFCAPGTAFLATPDGADAYLRLTFADTPPSGLVRGIGRLAAALTAYADRGVYQVQQERESLPMSV